MRFSTSGASFIRRVNRETWSVEPGVLPAVSKFLRTLSHFGPCPVPPLVPFLVYWFFAVFGGRHGIEAPSANIQAPEKHQASSTKPPATRLYWDLVLRYSLDVGAWCLVLRSGYSTENS